MNAGLDHHRIDAERTQFEPVGISQRLQRELTRAVHAHIRHCRAPCSGTHVNQKASAFTAHRRYDCPVDANNAKQIHVKQLLELLYGVSFRHPQCCDAGIIDYDIYMSEIAESLLNGSVDRGILGYIQVDDVKRPTFSARKRSQRIPMWRILSTGVAHGRKDGISTGRESLGSRASETCARPGD